MPVNTVKNSREQQPSEEKELASKMLRIQNKLFYLDVKQNRRGKFVKITEVGGNGQKSRILMSVPAANELKTKVDRLSAIYAKLSSHDPENVCQDGRIESDMIMRDNRRYYLDLKENSRGRFLRIAMMSMGIRVQIAIPAQGMIELRNTLADLIKSHSEEEEPSSELPESKVLHLGAKTFYFDVGSNRYGVFLRISEVRSDARTAITVPEQHWPKFCDILSEISGQLNAASKEHHRLVNGKSTAEQNGFPSPVVAEATQPPKEAITVTSADTAASPVEKKATNKTESTKKN